MLLVLYVLKIIYLLQLCITYNVHMFAQLPQEALLIPPHASCSIGLEITIETSRIFDHATVYVRSFIRLLCHLRTKIETH
jgi:hypothetical protein